ncbi:hypothetical protein NAPIS_ORF01926 [Vairimorpha apis BRL 01]|uniref:Uncharacterized protein n=1 Tax=Vairimorpha apis BRL 01 TaxID=1037528 RepID=T0MBD8_9MICR|nr:hypothetical protein NAPIS_ORF01926 [Vairimorpha apis BRL 01]
MSDLDTRLNNVLKKSTLFIAAQNIIEDEIIPQIISDVLRIVNKDNVSFESKQESLSDFLVDFFNLKNIDIDFNEADAMANVLCWIFEEYKMEGNDMYNKIMNIKTPDIVDDFNSLYNDESDQ